MSNLSLSNLFIILAIAIILPGLVIKVVSLYVYLKRKTEYVIIGSNMFRYMVVAFIVVDCAITVVALQGISGLLK